MNAPLIFSVTVALLALGCELFLMVLLQDATTPYKYLVLLDSVALTLMLSPVLYFFMYKPMKNLEQKYDDMASEGNRIKEVLPRCNECGKIMVEVGDWQELTDYLRKEFNVTFIPTSCTGCNQETERHQI